MTDTMQTIIKLELERHGLYKLAGRHQLTANQRDRIQHIAGELVLLWDRHRREDAAERMEAVRRENARRREEKRKGDSAA